MLLFRVIFCNLIVKCIMFEISLKLVEIFIVIIVNVK